MLIACLWALIQKNDLPVGFFAALGPGGGVGFTDIKESIAERLAPDALSTALKVTGTSTAGYRC